jgi:replicative DNA helicase
MRPEPEDEGMSRLRTPPHSLEAEQSVLGGLLLDNSAWDRAGDLLTESDFYRHEHRLIYAAIGALVNSNKGADVITVFERLQTNGKAADAGGILYLNQLAQSVPSAANMRRYAEIVRERAVLRKLVAASDEIATSAFNPGDRTASQVLDDAQAAVLRIAEQGPQTDDDWECADIGAVRMIDHINSVNSGDVKPDIIPTGFNLLDEKLSGGARPGELITIGMRSGMGKTAMAINILMNAAKAGEPGGMFSMEMPRQQVMMRMNSCESHVHLTKLKRPERLNDHDWSALSESVELIAKLPIHVSDKTSLTIAQIRSRARALKRKMGKLRVIVVDHIGLTRGTDPRAMRAYQIAEVTSGLKSLAKELNCVVYQLVQIKREADARTDAMPTLADIRDASSVEDDSDIVIFGHREFKNKPDLDDEWRYYAEIMVAKQRDGELGRLPLMYVGENTRFADWPTDRPAPTVKIRRSQGGL